MGVPGKPADCNCSGAYHHCETCPAHCQFPTGCCGECAGREGHDEECCSGYDS